MTMDINELKSRVDNMKNAKAERVSKSSVNNMIKNMLEDYTDGTVGMNENEKKEFEQSIYTKYKAGKKLTSKEMSYLARTNPDMYMHARRVQLMRELLEERLKHCKSKQEVDQLMDKAHSLVNDDDPDKTVLHSAYDDVLHEFKKSGKYSKLPDKAEKDTESKVSFSYVSWEIYYSQDSIDNNYVASAELAPADSVTSFEKVV